MAGTRKPKAMNDEIDMSNCNPGVYLILVLDVDGKIVETKKLIKQ